MADLTILGKKPFGEIKQMFAGGRPARVYSGFFAFATTETSGELKVPKDVSVIDDFQLTVIGGPETVYLDEKAAVSTTRGVLVVPSGKSLTIARSAGTTSGLIVAFRYIGY